MATYTQYVSYIKLMLHNARVLYHQYMYSQTNATVVLLF